MPLLTKNGMMAPDRRVLVPHMVLLLQHVYMIITVFVTDGVVLVDPEYLKERKVFAHVLAAFRYGREDLDVLGLTFRKDLFLASMQVYPAVKDQQKPLTRLQERLIKKLGPNAYPFFFEVRYSLIEFCIILNVYWFLMFSRY